MLILFRVVSAHESFKRWLRANFISTKELRQRKIAGCSMQSPALPRIAFSTSDSTLLAGIHRISRLCYHIKGEMLIPAAFASI